MTFISSTEFSDTAFFKSIHDEKQSHSCIYKGSYFRHFVDRTSNGKGNDSEC
jgi:hypothetical protein